jgi:hypothetical protein
MIPIEASVHSALAYPYPFGQLDRGHARATVAPSLRLRVPMRGHVASPPSLLSEQLAQRAEIARVAAVRIHSSVRLVASGFVRGTGVSCNASDTLDTRLDLGPEAIRVCDAKGGAGRHGGGRASSRRPSSASRKNCLPAVSPAIWASDDMRSGRMKLGRRRAPCRAPGADGHRPRFPSTGAQSGPAGRRREREFDGTAGSRCVRYRRG